MQNSDYISKFPPRAYSGYYCLLGNGSHEADGPFQIVAMKKEVQA